MAAYSLSFWKTILPQLAPWRDLTLDQRSAILELTAGYQVLTPALASLPAALRERFFEKDAKGRHRPLPEFRRLADFVDRLGKWSRPGTFDMTVYVQQLTTYTQRQAMTGIRSGPGYEVAGAALETRMREGWFARQMLERDSRDAFLATLSGWMPEEVVLTEKRYGCLRDWLKHALIGGTAAFHLHPGTFQIQGSGIPPEELLYLALAYGLVQVGRSPETLDVMVQALEPVKKVKQDPAKIEMRKLTVTRAFSRPYLIDDIEAYLRAVKDEPAPLLSDGIHVPVAHHRKIAKRFLALPEPLPRVGFEAEDRAKAAWWFISTLGLVSMGGRGRKTWKAGLDAKGEAWLALSRERKLEKLLAQAPCGPRKKRMLGERFSWLGEYESLPIPYAAMNSRLFDWLDAIVANLKDPVEFWDWLASAVGDANPLLADLETDPHLSGTWARWDQTPQTVFAEFLCHYLGRLSSLGAVALSRDAEGALGVSLSGVGQYLFGHAESWTLPQGNRPIAVVGGDFSIVLLEPAVELAVELAPFAEAVGADPDQARPATHFRLSRRSVQSGVHQGLAAADMLRILRAWSKTPLPANVVHEIEAWCGSKPTVKLRDAILVEGEDPMVIAEILSRFPKDFVRLSPTALKYLGEGKRLAVLKKLMKKGFFTA